MKKDAPVRTFRYSDAELKQHVDQFVLFARRDITEFSKRGYTELKLDAIAALAEAFLDLRSDEELLAVQVEFTTAKNELGDELTEQMRTILDIAGLHYGRKSARFNRFGTSEISRLSDAELIKNAKIIHRAATDFFADLVTEGLSSEMLDELLSTCNRFDESIDNREMSINDRDVATEFRVTKANELYDELTKIAMTGKSIWRTLNEAKYNDYLLYDAPDAKPETPTP